MAPRYASGPTSSSIPSFTPDLAIRTWHDHRPRQSRPVSTPALDPNRDAVIRLRDGRAMAYAEWGVPEGLPVLAFHGMPGSRLWCPDHFAPGMTTTERGVRLITFDRPGYGRSD